MSLSPADARDIIECIHQSRRDYKYEEESKMGRKPNPDTLANYDRLAARVRDQIEVAIDPASREPVTN